MNTKFICNQNKHTYSKGYLALPLQITGLPKGVEINGNLLQLKSSFHVSLLCVKNLIKKYGEEIENQILDIFCKFTNEHDVSFIGYKDEFRFVVRESDNKKTLVVMVNISNIEEFFQVLRDELDIEVDTQPTHITLYTLNLDEGIGINGQKDLENLTEIVTEKVPDDIKNVCKWI